MAISLHEAPPQFPHFFFNCGLSGLVKFFNQVGIHITERLLDALLEKDLKRIEKAENNMQRFQGIK